MEVINENSVSSYESKRILAGVLGILLVSLGIHKFVLGYTLQGFIMLLVSVLSFGFLAGIMALIGLKGNIKKIVKNMEIQILYLLLALVT